MSSRAQRGISWRQPVKATPKVDTLNREGREGAKVAKGPCRLRVLRVLRSFASFALLGFPPAPARVALTVRNYLLRPDRMAGPSIGTPGPSSPALLGMTVLVACLLTWALAPRARAQATAGPAQYGMALSADTVTVGDVFRLSVRVRAPEGATIEFPSGPDSAAAVQAVDSLAIVRGSVPGFVEETGTWRLAAWDVGQLPIVMPDIIVRTATGERRIPIRAAGVFVRSVLPEDSTKHLPKPARALFEAPAPPLWPWLLLAAALAALLGWWLWHRRRRAALGDPGEDAWVRAEREFARVEALRLVAAGEPGRHAALMVEVLRDYLARRFGPFPFGPFPLALTSTELLAATAHEPMVPRDSLAPLLAEVDLVKFARRPVTGDRATQLGVEARAIVKRVEASIVAARKAAEEAARRAAERDRAAKGTGRAA